MGRLPCLASERGALHRSGVLVRPLTLSDDQPSFPMLRRRRTIRSRASDSPVGLDSCRGEWGSSRKGPEPVTYFAGLRKKCSPGRETRVVRVSAMRSQRRPQGPRCARNVGGEQKMLALGRALMGNPKLLMLDEPPEGLIPDCGNIDSSSPGSALERCAYPIGPPYLFCSGCPAGIHAG
jgi:hypothetical protein